MTAAAECVLQDLLKHAVGVNMFCWASSRDQTAHEQGSLASVHERSMWKKLLKAADELQHAHVKVAGSRKRKIGKQDWPNRDTIDTYLNQSLPGNSMNFDVFAGAYYLRKFLRSGSYGSVYVGEERSTGLLRALKIMHCKKGLLSGREAMLQRYCSGHPNIIGLLDCFVSAFYVVLVMPLASESMYHHIPKVNVTLDYAKHFLRQIASGIAHMHSKSIMHRDLHSGNVLVVSAGGVSPASSVGGVSPAEAWPCVQLADFGLACKFDASTGGQAEPLSAAVVGGYNLPPEIAFLPDSTSSAHYTSALDVWCFGCLVLEVGNKGRPPFFNRNGRAGLRDRILDKFGSPPEYIIRRYGWVSVHDRQQVSTISWGVWCEERHRSVIQCTLRYDMTRRPGMQACTMAFVE